MRYRFVAMAIVGFALGTSLLYAAQPQQQLRPLPKCFMDVTADGRKLGAL